MENEKIFVKGTPKKNKIARIIFVAGIAMIIISFLAALYYFYNEGRYEYRVGYFEYSVIYYKGGFIPYYFGEFFGSCIHGYLLIAGVIAIIVGLVMKSNFEKCEITVTDQCIYGKDAHGREIDIPLNQVVGLHTCSFWGVSVISIGQINNFYCFENRKEIMKAISYFMASPKNLSAAPGIIREENNGRVSDRELELIKQFKALLDSGVLTQDEFDAKKREILGFDK